MQARRAVFETHRRGEAQRHADLLNSLARPEVPVTADDVLGIGDREKRIREHERAKARVAREQARLGLMKPGQEYDDLPSWATKKW